MSNVMKLVPKIRADREGDTSEHALGAVKLALETLERYLATGEASPNRVIIMMSSDLDDGTQRSEYITANIGRYVALGMIETIKHEMLNEGE